MSRSPPIPSRSRKAIPGRSFLFWLLPSSGGGAGWYFKVYRPKHQRAAQPEEDYGDELEDYDDAPSWDEDESTEDDA